MEKKSKGRKSTLNLKEKFLFNTISLHFLWCLKKTPFKEFLREIGQNFLNSEVSCISTSFKKSYSKKIQRLVQFLQNCFSKHQLLRFLIKTKQYFFKLVWYSNHLKKISILSHYAKKLQSSKYLQNYINKKHLTLKNFFSRFLILLKKIRTVAVIDLKFKFWVSR